MFPVEHSVAENSVAGTEDAQEIEGKDNVNENAKAIQHIEGTVCS